MKKPYVRKAKGRGFRNKAALAKVQEMGELRPVPPAAERVDGSPLLAPGQVYATPYGTKYHVGWCQVVADRWDEQPGRVLVINRSEAGKRGECQSCLEPLTSSTA